MKKPMIVFAIICILIIGVIIGRPSGKTESEKIQDKIDDFEKSLEDPNYHYEPDPQYKSKVKPNLSNSAAKGGEKIITGVFDYAFGLLEKIAK